MNLNKVFKQISIMNFYIACHAHTLRLMRLIFFYRAQRNRKVHLQINYMRELNEINLK
jgi:hypothetical protein